MVKDKMKAFRKEDASNVFIPPEGYVLEKVLLCSFGLSPTAIGELLLNFFPEGRTENRRHLEARTDEHKSFFSLIGELKAGNAGICFQNGQIDKLERSARLTEALRVFLYPQKIIIKKTFRSRFHPKLYWALFTPLGKGPRLARIVIGSKNATETQSVECGVKFEFTEKSGQSKKKAKDPFVKQLADWARITLKDPNKRGLAKLISNLEAGTQGMTWINRPPEILLLGNTTGDGTNEKLDLMLKEATNLVVVSPWANAKMIQTYLSTEKRHLVTLSSTLRTLSKAQQRQCLDLEKFLDLQRIKDTSDIHAKMILSKAVDGSISSYIGSANFTRGGWEKNRELGVLLKTKPGSIPSGFWDDLEMIRVSKEFDEHDIVPPLDWAGLLREYVSSGIFVWKQKRALKICIEPWVGKPSPDQILLEIKSVTGHLIKLITFKSKKGLDETIVCESFAENEVQQTLVVSVWIKGQKSAKAGFTILPEDPHQQFKSLPGQAYRGDLFQLLNFFLTGKMIAVPIAGGGEESHQSTSRSVPRTGLESILVKALHQSRNLKEARLKIERVLLHLNRRSKRKVISEEQNQIAAAKAFLGGMR